MKLDIEGTTIVKKVLALAVLGIAILTSAACASDADVASRNVSKAADNFEVLRRVVFYNGITGDYMLTIEGYCSLGNNDDPGELTVTCKTQDGYKKNFLGLSDNVTYFVEQLKPVDASTDHYRVVFKPSVILPDIDVRQRKGWPWGQTKVPHCPHCGAVYDNGAWYDRRVEESRP